MAMLAAFLAKKGGPCEVLLRSLLHYCFLLDFGVSRPSLERIFGPTLEQIFFAWTRFGSILASKMNSCWLQNAT